MRDPGAVAVALGDADLAEAPEFDPQGWHETFSETYVRFSNRERKFKEDAAGVG